MIDDINNNTTGFFFQLKKQKLYFIIHSTMLLPKRIKALTSFMTMMWLWSNWRNMLSYPLTWGKKLGYANYSVCTVLIYWLLIKHFLLFGMFEIINFFRPICIPCTRETNAALHLVDQSCESQGVITLYVCCIASS